MDCPSAILSSPFASSAPRSLWIALVLKSLFKSPFNTFTPIYRGGAGFSEASERGHVSAFCR